jgi:hypothetical protein
MTKTMKDGCRTVTTEFEVRELDAHGDAIDVDCYETKQEAMAFAERLIKRGAAAVVVEKHISRAPACYWKTPDTYKTVALFGDAAVIAKGEWQ